MKKRSLFLSMMGLLLSLTSFGQNPYVADANSQLRHIFSQITYPNNDVLLLYDRSVKLVDTTFYRNNSPDTLNDQVWKQLYEEVYYAAHDTLLFDPVSGIDVYSSGFFGDTIPIALMDYDFYFCKEQAITTGNYFIFDTINDLLFDHPAPLGTPFGQSNLFAAAPLKISSDFGNPVFRIGQDLFFTDDVNMPFYLASPSVRINFDDGTGWHFFDMGVVNYYQASYSTEGRHIIEIELLDKSRKTIKSSKSDFFVLKSESAVEPDRVFDFDGMQVGVFDGCGGTDKTEKVIIFLEGIDILDGVPAWGRGLDDIYHDMIHSRYIEELRNFNYTYYVVNWKNSRIDMRFNALYLVNLIELLKGKYKLNREQFVVMGESMGGVIARYALTFMESKEYTSGDYSGFFIEAAVPQNAHYLAANPDLLTLGPLNRIPGLDGLMHKTRELITLDSPHQGANIPLSVQHAYRKLFGMVAPGFQYVTTTTNQGLESRAARQMLIYHIDGKVSPLSSASAYLGDPAHYSFYGQLNKIGDYPKYCKLVALSSGSMDGANQEGVLGTRVANDLLIDFNTQLYGRIFWVKVPLLSAVYQLRTNPNGSGTFYSAAIGNFTIKLKLKWFGIKITNTYGNIYSDNQVALSVKPYCVSAGGYYFTGIDIGGNTAPSSYSLSKNWLFNLFSYNMTSSSGCITLNSHVGWQGFSSMNLDFYLCSNGTDFGFVPLQSALDYGKGLNMPLNHNLMTENINTKLGRTPFDVIVGYEKGVNYDHLGYRDNLIYNVTGTSASNCNSYFPNGKFAYYDADLIHECEVKRSFLCLEIGDEELYLENWTLNRKARFESEYDLYVNRRNPYYRYPSTTGTPLLGMDAIYSKEKPFIISSIGYASFNSNGLNSPTGIGFDYVSPQSSSLWEQNFDDVIVCMVNYAQQKNIQIETNTDGALEKDETLKLYPNPTNGDLLVVDYAFSSEEDINLEIVDVSGKAVYESGLIDGGKGTFTLNLSELKSGMYLVRITGNSKMLVSRLIIQ